MAELDDKLLKNLDKTLESMNERLITLETTLSGVKNGLNKTFDPSIITSFSDALRGIKTLRLIDAEKASQDINKVKDTLAKLQDAYQKWEGGELALSPKALSNLTDLLAKYKELNKNIDKGSEQRSVELANAAKKEADAVEAEERRKQKAFQDSVKQQTELARKYAELEKLRSDVFGGRSYGKLSGKEKVQWTEMDYSLEKIKKQMEEIEKLSPGSRAKGESIYKEQEAITRAKRESAEEQKRIAKEEAEYEKLLRQEQIQEERRKAAETKRLAKEEADALSEYIRLYREKTGLLKTVSPLDAKVVRNQQLSEQERGLYDASWNRIYAINDEMAKLRSNYVSVLEYEEKIQANGQEQVALGKVRLTQEQALAKEKERQAKSESKQQSDEAKIQKQADAIVKKRIDLERQVQRIDNDRAIRQQTNSKISQQALDAESRKYEALLQRINQLNNALAKLEGKQAGVTARAEQRNAPYMNYVAAAEEERKAKAIENSTKKLKEQKNTLDSMLPTLQRLASAFGVAFSVRGLAQFGKKLIETRGEFEMQFVAMKQIIGDVDAATKIWNQTMQQALQSPFKAMELVKYTKQLAAYRIETDKLFDTTKRLADVSAGLGVDMQRLILAYGQVKAANYLRASEIRQFTEAGINVLGELAQYFTEIRGTAYSTAQVMEMVTKRMVRFDDVEAIFKRMTDAGGTFFNMQEVQANTVKGQINKLHDAYDQMLNTIGQANQGVLRNFISLLIDMVKNWQKVANTMKWVGVILGSIIIATRAMRIEMEATAFAEAGTAISLRGLSGAMARYIAAAKGAETATRGFSLALKSVPVWGWILAGVSALIGVGSAIVSKQRQIREENEKFDESTRELRKDIAYVDSYTDAIVKLSQEINALNAVENKSEEQEKRLTEAQEEREGLIKKLAEENPKYASTVRELKDDVDALLASEKEELETLKATLAIRQALHGEGVEEKVSEYESSVAGENKATSDLENNKIAIIDYIGKLNEAGEVESQLLNNLRKQAGTMSAIGKEGMAELEEGVESFTRSVSEDILNFDEAYGKFIDLYLKLRGNVSKSAGGGAYYSNFLQVFKEAAQYGAALSDAQWDLVSAETALKGVLDEVFAKYKYYEQYISLSRAFEAATTEEEKQKIRAQILKFWSDVFDQEGFTGASRKLAENYFVSMIGGDFGIKSFSQSSATTKKALEDWQKRVNEAIDKASKGFNEKRAQLSKEAQDNMLEIELYKIKDPFQTLEDAQSDILTRLKEVRARIASFEVKGQVAIDNAEYQALKLTEEELEQVRILLGAVAKVTGGGGHRENASKLISLIKEMRSEYDKLSKSAYGYAKSEATVREAYKDSVKEILGKAGITDYDFTTNEGMIAALEKVKTYATKLGKDAAAEVQKYIDQLETEIEINAQVRIREDFGKQMEKAFGDYELTLDIEKLNLPSDVLADMFDIETVDLSDLRNKVVQFYEERAAIEADPTELVKQVEGYYKKIDDMERKQQRERIKEYAKYLEYELSERAKIEMEYVRKSAEAETTRGLTREQRDTIDKRLKKERDEKLAKQEWEDFKSSETYIQMMEDLEHQGVGALEVMRQELERIRANAANLSPRALKEVVNALEKINEITIKRGMPIGNIIRANAGIASAKEAAIGAGLGKEEVESRKAARDTLENIKKTILEREKEYRTLSNELGVEKELARLESERAKNNAKMEAMFGDTFAAESDEQIQQRIAEAVGNIETSRKNIAEYQEQAKEADEETLRTISTKVAEEESNLECLLAERGLLEEALRLRLAIAKAEANRGDLDDEVRKNLQERVEQLEEELKKLQAQAGAVGSVTKAYGILGDTVQDAFQKMGQWGSQVEQTFESFKGMMQALGTDVDTDTWDTLSTSFSVLNTATSTAASAAAKFAAGDYIGASLDIIKGLMDIATQIAELHDKKIDRSIEKSKEKVEDLQKAYERLEKSIEKTFDTVSYIREYNQEVQNLNEQIEEANRQIAAAQDYKNAEKKKEAIEAAEDAKQEALDALEEIRQAQIEVFGGIGRDSYRSAAEGFVDAWKSAFLETDDGLQGLQDHFDEFLNDWFVKQATMRYAAAALEPVFKMIDDAVDPYGAGGANVVMQELEAIKEWARVNFPKISDTLEEISRPFIGEGEGSLSGLAAGIQGMTEEQANIREAYLNSVRGYTASIDMNVARIAEMLGAGGVNTNPQLQQLNLIAANTQATHQLLQSVTKSGHSQGGYGIKVFAD